MPVKLSSTLGLLPVCRIATPNLMFVQREGNLSEPEEEGTVEVSEFELLSSSIRGLTFILWLLCDVISLFVLLEQFALASFYFFFYFVC